MVAESDYSIDCSQESRNAFVLHSLVLRSWAGGVRGRGLWQEQGKARQKDLVIFRQLCEHLHSSPISTGGARHKVEELFVPPDSHPVFSL